MNFGNSLLSVLGSVGKYSAVAAQAAHEAQAQVGPGNGATKKQVAIAYTLAAAHAGETVDFEQVQKVSAAVDLAVNIANMLGAFGPSKTAPVTIPALDAAAAAGGK